MTHEMTNLCTFDPWWERGVGDTAPFLLEWGDEDIIRLEEWDSRDGDTAPLLIFDGDAHMKLIKIMNYKLLTYHIQILPNKVIFTQKRQF